MKDMMRVILRHPTVILRHDQIVIIPHPDQINVQISDLIHHHVRIDVILLRERKNIQVLGRQTQDLVNDLLNIIVIHLNITSLEDVLGLMMIQNPIVVHHQGTPILSQRVLRRKRINTKNNNLYSKIKTDETSEGITLCSKVIFYSLV